VWVRQAGSNTFERAEGIAVDDLGNIVLGGTFSGTTSLGTNVFVSNGGNDGFVAKFDARGSNLWARAIGGSGDERVYGIALDPAGNVYAGGHFFETVDFGGDVRTSTGSNDLFAVKYDSPGNLVWVFTGGGANRDQGFQLGLDAATNLYICGTFTGTATYGGTTLTNAGGGYDLVLLKLSPTGQLVWARRGGGTGTDEPRGMTVDAAGNSYVVGVFGGTANYGSTNLVSAGGLDAVVLKYDPDGNLLWEFSGGSSTDDEAKRVTVDAAGNVYFNGFFGPGARFGTNTLTSAGGGDFYVAKLNVSGDFQWIRQGGGPADDSGRSVATDRDGNVYVTGYYRYDAVFDDVTLTNASLAGNSGIVVAKYAADGTLLWAEGFSSPTGCEGWDIKTDTLGNVYFVGQFNGTANFGSTNLISRGNSDICYGKIITATPPPLSVTLAGTNFALSWSVLASEFRLESSALLASPTQWSNFSTTPATLAASNVVTLPLDRPQRFLRLKWP
jgi:hypothetical protein